MILVVDADFGIAKNGSIPWMFSEDLRHFQQCTLNKTVVMGINTFLSLPNGALVNRKNCIISRNKHRLPKIGWAINTYSMESWSEIAPCRLVDIYNTCYNISCGHDNKCQEYFDTIRWLRYKSHTNRLFGYNVACDCDILQNKVDSPYNIGFSNMIDIEIWTSLEASITKYPDAWIIGGANLANYALEHMLVDRLLLTVVHRSYDADLFLQQRLLSQFSSKNYIRLNASTPDGHRYSIIDMMK